MAKIWVTGAAGLIGGEVVRSAARWCPDDTVVGLTRADFDLTDPGAVERRFRQDDPDVIIHCAALSRPVDCELHPDLARRVNVLATRQLAELAAGRCLIYLSTDLVLDGAKGGYTEEDPANPLHLYGETKLAGEEAVRGHDEHLVVRTALNFGASASRDRGFNEQMRAALAAGRDFTLFEDEYRCPLATEVTARALLELARVRVGGLYLLGGAERVSRWQIGLALRERWGKLPGTIRPGSLKEYQGPPRAADLSMHCSKVQSLLSFRLSGFHEWLGRHPEAPV
jgi:dTDP-4-dehydrorhamnose reductase